MLPFIAAKRLHHVRAHIACVKHRRVHNNAKSVIDVISDIRERAEVKHVAWYNRVPDRETCYIVLYNSKPCLHCARASAMTAECVVRVVLYVVWQRCRVNVANISKTRDTLFHQRYESFEKAFLGQV